MTTKRHALSPNAEILQPVSSGRTLTAFGTHAGLERIDAHPPGEIRSQWWNVGSLAVAVVKSCIRSGLFEEVKMEIAENEQMGLMAVSLDDTGDNILKFGRMKRDGSIRAFVPDCSLPFSAFVIRDTKKGAQELAKNLRFPAHHVERVGSRFCTAWGIRHDLRDNYFLATFD